MAGGVSYFWRCHRLQHYNEEQIRPLIDAAFKELNSIGAILVAVTGDNASGVQNAIMAFCGEHPAVMGFRCQAHSIALLVNDVMQLDPLPAAAAILERLADFCDDADNMKALVEAQMSAGVPENRCIRPARPAVTRWNSKLKVIQQIRQLELHLSTVGFILDETDLQLLHFAQQVLLPFADASDHMQRDGSTLQDAVEMWPTLQQRMETLRLRQGVGAASRRSFFVKATAAIKERSQAHLFGNDDYDVLSLLNPRVPAPGNCKNTVSKITLMARHYLGCLSWSPEEVEAALQAIAEDIGEYLLRRGDWVHNPDETSEKYWQRLLLVAPNLPRVALTANAAHSTEACVERAFSAQGLLHSDLRAALSLEAINSLMVLRWNGTLCNQL